MGSVKIEEFIDKFSSLTKKPAKKLIIQKDFNDDIKYLVKSLYDFTKAEEKSSEKKNQALSEIIVNEFDEEQIWQQIELQNSECWEQLTWDVANCISTKTDLTFPIKFEEKTFNDHQISDNDDFEISNQDDDHIDDSDNNLENDHEKKNTKRKNKISKPKGKTSIVDDKFFKLNEMEKFLLSEEKKEEKGKKRKEDDEEDDSIDLFDDIDDDDSEDEGNEMRYYDFFNEEEYNDEEEVNDEDEDNDKEEDIDDQNEEFREKDDKKSKTDEKKVRFLDQDSGSESDETGSDVYSEKEIISNGNSEVTEKKSEFELRQQRLKQQISRLEDKTLTEAPWQLKGEVDAKKRPENSLLQEVLDFDLTSRPPPIITEQTTVTLEGLIKQRIKDKSWDDVIRKDKPVDDQLDFKKSVVLDQSKSKMSLAQVYEAEYLKQKQELSGDVGKEEPESHKEIRDAMNKLFSKLDALSHYHYTPKPPQAEVKIVSNTPAISMEEVAPIATSEAALLAPEEVKRKHKGDLMSKDERNKTDKNRERRKKKKLQRQKGKVINVTEHRNTKKGVEANDKSLKTSKAFFQQLNDESSSIIKSKSKKIISK